MNQLQPIINLVADPYPPYQYEESGVIKGIDHDIITAAFKELRIEVRVQLFPWDECVSSINQKRADGIFQIVRTPEREKVFVFSDPLRTAKTVFLRKLRSNIELRNEKKLAEQLIGYKVGALSGYSYNTEVDSLEESIKKEFQDQGTMMRELSGGRLDLVVMDLGVAYYLIDKMDIKDIERVAGYETSRQLYVAFQRDSAELRDLFNSGLDRVKKKGIYNTIFHTYGIKLRST